MISLASLIERFETDYLAQYSQCALHNQRQALDAMKRCRSTLAPRMLAQCGDCGEQRLVPHSCGHRLCPHCQHHESQAWIERQTQALVPGSYFLITFTLPAELRSLAWEQQRSCYAALMDCAWATLHTFSQNHTQLQGSPGAVAVLHTHSRQLAFHPHVHLAMPAAALDADKCLWRTLRRSAKGAGYLFNHKALAKVFRAKFIAALLEAGLPLPPGLPQKWVVDCKAVGNGEKALVYLGRYAVPGRDSGARHPALRERLRHLPLARQQNWQDGLTHRQRGHLLVAGAATRAAQGLSAFAQLWLSAPQQQTPDRAAAPAGVQTVQNAEHGAHTYTAPATAAALLRRCDGHRAPTNLALLRRAAACTT